MLEICILHLDAPLIQQQFYVTEFESHVGQRDF